MDSTHVKNIIEACLLVAGRAMSLRQIDELFVEDDNRPDKDTIKACLEELKSDYEGRGIELVQVASGYRLQSRESMSPWVARLFPEKPPRYSRALLETLVLVAYRQPITRGEIEEIRGVAVSSNIVKTLQERQWVKEVGFKDVPGKPALLGTTKEFLDYFNLKRLDDLPPLSEIKNLEDMDSALVEAAGIAPESTVDAANDEGANTAEDGNAAEGEAASSVGENAENLDSAQSEEGVDENTTEAENGPLTFAGLISSLPNLEDSADSEADVDAGTVEATDAAALQDNTADTTDSTDSTEVSVYVEASDATDAELADVNAQLDAHESEAQTDDESEAEAQAETEAEVDLEANDAQEALLSAVASFADEHQQDVNARDALESQLSTHGSASDEDDLDIESAHSRDDGGVAEAADANLDNEADLPEVELAEAESAEMADADQVDTADGLGNLIDASSTSPDILSDTFTGDPPSAGETLH